MFVPLWAGLASSKWDQTQARLAFTRKSQIAFSDLRKAIANDSLGLATLIASTGALVLELDLVIASYEKANPLRHELKPGAIHQDL